jgi:hypothetical protein
VEDTGCRGDVTLVFGLHIFVLSACQRSLACWRGGVACQYGFLLSLY